MLIPLPLTCGAVIDGAVISRLNICNESLLLLLDLAMGSLSPSQLWFGLDFTATPWWAHTHTYTQCYAELKAYITAHHCMCCLPTLGWSVNSAFLLYFKIVLSPSGECWELNGDYIFANQEQNVNIMDTGSPKTEAPTLSLQVAFNIRWFVGSRMRWNRD